MIDHWMRFLPQKGSKARQRKDTENRSVSMGESAEDPQGDGEGRPR